MIYNQIVTWTAFAILAMFILDVCISPNRKNVNLSQILYVLDFSFFMSQDDAYYHIHQNDPAGGVWG